ncbi:MAG: hypothetical protein IPL32_03965 [Chloracidobacterium sp.]|nr:hypothetical protein [Chloracidobacterium sp.]
MGSSGLLTDLVFELCEKLFGFFSREGVDSDAAKLDYRVFVPDPTESNFDVP